MVKDITRYRHGDRDEAAKTAQKVWNDINNPKNSPKRKGYRGTYKDKDFVYKVRLPKGAVRHHVVYRDEDPNYGIIFCTQGYHNWEHKSKERRQ